MAWLMSDERVVPAEFTWVVRWRERWRTPPFRAALHIAESAVGIVLLLACAALFILLAI